MKKLMIARVLVTLLILALPLSAMAAHKKHVHPHKKQRASKHEKHAKNRHARHAERGVASEKHKKRHSRGPASVPKKASKRRSPSSHLGQNTFPAIVHQS